MNQGQMEIDLFEKELFNFLVSSVSKFDSNEYKAVVNLQDFLNRNFRLLLRSCTYSKGSYYYDVESYRICRYSEASSKSRIYYFEQFKDGEVESISNKDNGAARQIIRRVFNRRWEFYINDTYEKYRFYFENDPSFSFSNVANYPTHSEIYEEAVAEINKYFSLYTKNVDYNVIIAVSGEKYESQASLGCIAFIPYNNLESLLDSDLYVKFNSDSRIPFCVKNKRAIRKQLQMSGKSGCLVVGFDPDNEQHMTYGLIDMKIARKYPYVEFCESNFWKFYMPSGGKKSTAQFEYRNSHVWLPHGLYNELDLVYKLEKELSISRDSDACKRINKIVNIAVKQRHGTSIVITSDDECKRLCDRFKRGYSVKCDFGEKSKSIGDQLLGLTSIDGAILINKNGEIIGIGAILDGEVIEEGDSSRGARYNSIHNYISLHRDRNNEECMGIIISEDRIVDFV